MKTLAFNQTLLVRIFWLIGRLLSTIAACVALQVHHAQAWCGPSWAIDAYDEAILSYNDALAGLDAQMTQAVANDDQEAINSISTQQVGVLTAIIYLQATYAAYEGPCPVADESCPTCGLAMSECSGHEDEQCPVCLASLSSCSGHSEAQCPSCYSPISQCSCSLP